MIVGPYQGDRYLISIEAADTVHVFDASAFTFAASYPTGDRPFPTAATSDGRLVFVPGHTDGTVTIIDLFNDRVLETVSVGTNPSGGAVLPGDIEYAVVVRGEDRWRSSIRRHTRWSTGSPKGSGSHRPRRPDQHQRGALSQRGPDHPAAPRRADPRDLRVWHKYWLLERLRERDDIALLDLRVFLPN